MIISTQKVVKDIENRMSTLKFDSSKTTNGQFCRFQIKHLSHDN